MATSKPLETRTLYRDNLKSIQKVYYLEKLKDSDCVDPYEVGSHVIEAHYFSLYHHILVVW